VAWSGTYACGNLFLPPPGIESEGRSETADNERRRSEYDPSEPSRLPAHAWSLYKSQQSTDTATHMAGSSVGENSETYPETSGDRIDLSGLSSWIQNGDNATLLVAILIIALCVIVMSSTVLFIICFHRRQVRRMKQFEAYLKEQTPESGHDGHGEGQFRETCRKDEQLEYVTLARKSVQAARSTGSFSDSISDFTPDISFYARPQGRPPPSDGECNPVQVSVKTICCSETKCLDDGEETSGDHTSLITGSSTTLTAEEVAPQSCDASDSDTRNSISSSAVPNATVLLTGKLPQSHVNCLSIATGAVKPVGGSHPSRTRSKSANQPSSQSVSAGDVGTARPETVLARSQSEDQLSSQATPTDADFCSSQGNVEKQTVPGTQALPESLVSVEAENDKKSSRIADDNTVGDYTLSPLVREWNTTSIGAKADSEPASCAVVPSTSIDAPFVEKREQCPLSEFSRKKSSQVHPSNIDRTIGLPSEEIATREGPFPYRCDSTATSTTLMTPSGLPRGSVEAGSSDSPECTSEEEGRLHEKNEPKGVLGSNERTPETLQNSDEARMKPQSKVGSILLGIVKLCQQDENRATGETASDEMGYFSAQSSVATAGASEGQMPAPEAFTSGSHSSKEGSSGNKRQEKHVTPKLRNELEETGAETTGVKIVPVKPIVVEVFSRDEHSGRPGADTDELGQDGVSKGLVRKLRTMFEV
jgi:hypothetical protein